MPNFFINVKEKGAKKAEKNIKGLNGALGGLASKAALAAGGFFGASMLLSGMKQAIDLAGQQEAAEKALETALGGTSQALLNQASALQQVSVFGDEAIIQQQAFLGSLKFSEDQIKNIIPVAMDLAAATGMTLESAVRNTAKTFSGLAGELGELVPQLRGLTKEQMMAGDAVKVMGDLYPLTYNGLEGEWRILDTKRIRIKRVLELDWETYEFKNDKYAKALSTDLFTSNGNPITIINKNYVPQISISPHF